MIEVEAETDFVLGQMELRRTSLNTMEFVMYGEQKLAQAFLIEDTLGGIIRHLNQINHGMIPFRMDC